MRNGSNILNHADFQTGALQSADGSLTAGAGAFNQTFNLLQTMHHGLLGGHIGSLLGGKRRAFTRALKALRACAGPRNGIAGLIGDCNNCIVKGRLNMGYTYSIFFFSFLLRICLRAN